MKTKFVIFSILILLGGSIKSQSRIILDSDIKTLKKPEPIRNDIKSGEKHIDYLESGYKFLVVKKTKDTVKLRIYPPFIEKADSIIIKDITDREKSGKKVMKVKNDSYDRSEYYNDKVYSVSRKDFDSIAKPYTPRERMSIGIVTLPYKARFKGSFSFSPEFNLNTTLNIFLWNPFGGQTGINLQVGSGIGTVSLDPLNSDVEADKSTHISCLSFLSGFMIDYKKVQFGIYAGMDFINNQSNYNWDSHGKMWFGMGIGYKIFNITISEDGKKGQK